MLCSSLVSTRSLELGADRRTSEKTNAGDEEMEMEMEMELEMEMLGVTVSLP